jgi:hypothetical protein
MAAAGSVLRAGLGAGLICALLLPGTAAVAVERTGGQLGIVAQEHGAELAGDPAETLSAGAVDTSVSVALPLLGDRSLYIVGQKGVVRATVTASATEERPDPGPPVGIVEFFDGAVSLGSAEVAATTALAGVATLETDLWSQGGARQVSDGVRLRGLRRDADLPRGRHDADRARYRAHRR